MARRCPAFALHDDARAAHRTARSRTGHRTHLDARATAFYEARRSNTITCTERSCPEHGRFGACAETGCIGCTRAGNIFSGTETCRGILRPAETRNLEHGRIAAPIGARSIRHHIGTAEGCCDERELPAAGQCSDRGGIEIADDAVQTAKQFPESAELPSGCTERCTSRQTTDRPAGSRRPQHFFGAWTDDERASQAGHRKSPRDELSACDELSVRHSSRDELAL